MAQDYYCGQDKMFTFYGWDYNSEDTAWVYQNNPYNYKVTVSLDVWEWGWQGESNKVCVSLDGQVWCSDIIGDKGLQWPYGYMEYEDGQLISAGLDSAQIPVDFRFIRTQCYTYPGAYCRIEDGFARVTFATTAKDIKWGLYMPAYDWPPAGQIYPRCRVEEVPPGSELVRYYDLMGREVVPKNPGIYIELRNGTAKKVWVGDYELQNVGR